MSGGLKFMQWKRTYSLFRRRVDPRRHLILLVMCRREIQTILLVALEIEDEVHRKQRVKVRGVLDQLDFLS